ncbi:MAG: hypothetical protein LAT84_14310 [Balneolia bacterium]|nr:hypothetical protein [Balneolia bacterium]
MPGPTKAVASKLTWFYNRNGYVRRQKKERLENESAMSYKKGEEIRLIANTKSELRTIQSLLRKAGFKYGKPYDRGRRYCQPVYGKQAVARFLQMVESEADD